MLKVYVKKGKVMIFEKKWEWEILFDYERLEKVYYVSVLEFVRRHSEAFSNV